MNGATDVSRILPPREDEGDPVTTSARIPKKLVERIDAIAKRSRYSRNDVMVHFLRWATNEYEDEERKLTSKR